MKKDRFNNLFLLIGIVFILYYIVCGLAYRFGQSMLWVWPVVGIGFIIRYAVFKTGKVNVPAWLKWIVRAVCIVCCSVFLLAEGMVISGFFSRCPASVDYLLLLGAKTGSITIENRINTAAKYLNANPDTMVICTGGQGSDEEMPEGEYMKRGLIERGISPDRIFVEDRSNSTYENMAFSSTFIEDKNASVAVVSNNYHVARAMALARKHFSGDVYGIPMLSNYISLPHYMVREFFTITVDFLRGNLAF